MAPCKRQLKATRHLICGSCSNWVDFVKSGCEKSWAEVQADSFSFECRGCARMKELEVELEELRLLVVAMVGREQGSCASSSGGGTVDDKVSKDTRDARESSPQPGRKLRGGKVTGHRETGRKETGRKGTEGKTTRVKEMGVGETGGKEKGVGETGGKTTGVKERGVGETGGKEKGVGETGGKTTRVKEMGVGETGGKEKGVGETGGKTTGVKERGVGETGGKEKGVGETEGKTTGVKERGVGETRAKEWEVGETGGKGSGQNVMEGIERKSYSAAVIEGVRKRARVFVGDSIVRKTDRVLNKGDDVVVCLPGAKIEAITERVKNIVGSGKGGSVLVHVGTNNVEREGTTAIVRKYRQLVRTLKQTRVEQVILSGILPVMGRRGHKYRNCRGMAINMLVQRLCREEEVGFVDLWGSFVGRADMYMKDGLHLSGKGAAVFADKLSAAVDSDLGTMTNVFGSKHSLN